MFHFGVRVVVVVLQVVGRTRWPAAHDRVADLKQVIATLITVLKEKVDTIEDSMDTRHMRHMAPADAGPSKYVSP